MSGPPSLPTSTNNRTSWFRRQRQHSDQVPTSTANHYDPTSGFVPSRSGFAFHQEHGPNSNLVSPLDPREHRHRQLRRVSSALSPPTSPAFGGSPHAEQQPNDHGASPISPLTPEVLKRRATRLGSLIGKGRRDEVTRGYDNLLPRSAHATQSPTFESSYAAAFGEPPRSAPSAVTSFYQNSDPAALCSQQRLSTSSSSLSHPRSEPWNGGAGTASFRRSSSQIDHAHTQMAAVLTTSPTTYATYHFPHLRQPENPSPAPPPHIVSARTYPPVTSPNPTSRPHTSSTIPAPVRQQRKESDQLDASELAAFVEATAALSFFPEDPTARRSSHHSSTASVTRSSQRSVTPTPSHHRNSSSRSGASPARMAAPLPPLPRDEVPASSRIPSSQIPFDTSPFSGRRGRSPGPPPQQPLPVPPTFSPIQRSTSYSSTFAHSPPPIPNTEITEATPTTPVGVERATHISQARSNSPYRFNLPSRTLTTVAPPPTRRPPINNNPITRVQALAEALQGMDAEDESLATGHGSGNLHGPEAGASVDDELPDYATSQMEHTARQRWEAAQRARELDEAWRRGRGRGLR